VDTSEVISQLKALQGPNFSEVYHKTVFKCHRQKKNGNHQEVTIEIFDAGEEHHLRYHCVAIGDDGTRAIGNPDRSLETVFATLHWYDLDRG